LEFASINRRWHDYTNEAVFRELLCDYNPELVINGAAFIPERSVDDCKHHASETIRANTVLPVMLSEWCGREGVAFAQISTGCLYDDAKNYTEEDKPTRDFDGYCGLYLVSKYWAERIVSRNPNTYIWRIRLIFDNLNHPKNYLTKLKAYPQVWDQVNSLTHRGDYVKAALDLWQKRAPFGTYHMCNPGVISARAIVNMAGWEGKEFVEGPCRGGTLSTAKLEATGVKMRNVEEAVRASLMGWREQ